MNDPSDPADPARRRFAILSLLRLMAAAMIAVGIVIAAGRIDWVDNAIVLPLGLGLIGVGLADMLLIVPILTRRWRSRD